MLIVEPNIDQPFTIEEIEMSIALAHPGQTQRLSFRTKNAGGSYADAASLSIIVKDPTNTQRVAYDSDNLSNGGVGDYSYTFDLPDVVVEGEWHVEISATDASGTDIRYVYFEVEDS